MPRVTLVTRKTYGGAYIAMNARSLGATKVFAWPTAEVAVMGAIAAIRILHRRKLAEVADDARAQVEAELAAEHEQLAGGLARAVEIGVVDEIVEPTHTRRRIAAGDRRRAADPRPARQHPALSPTHFGCETGLGEHGRSGTAVGARVGSLPSRRTAVSVRMERNSFVSSVPRRLDQESHRDPGRPHRARGPGSRVSARTPSSTRPCGCWRRAATTGSRWTPSPPRRGPRRPRSTAAGRPRPTWWSTPWSGSRTACRTTSRTPAACAATCSRWPAPRAGSPTRCRWPSSAP